MYEISINDVSITRHICNKEAIYNENQSNLAKSRIVQVHLSYRQTNLWLGIRPTNFPFGDPM